MEQAIQQTDDMIRGGLAIPNVSAYNSPVMAVPKSLGRGELKPKLRLVVDMRRQNSQTMKVIWPLIPTHEALDKAQGYEWYNCSDCCSGFTQIRRASRCIDPRPVFGSPRRMPNGPPATRHSPRPQGRRAGYRACGARPSLSGARSRTNVIVHASHLCSFAKSQGLGL